MKSLKETLIYLVDVELAYCKDWCRTNKEILISKNRVYGMVTLAFNHQPDLDDELWDWWKDILAQYNELICQYS